MSNQETLTKLIREWGLKATVQSIANSYLGESTNSEIDSLCSSMSWVEIRDLIGVICKSEINPEYLIYFNRIRNILSLHAARFLTRQFKV